MNTLLRPGWLALASALFVSACQGSPSSFRDAGEAAPSGSDGGGDALASGGSGTDPSSTGWADGGGRLSVRIDGAPEAALCPGECATLAAVAEGGGPLSFVWSGAALPPSAGPHEVCVQETTRLEVRVAQAGGIEFGTTASAGAMLRVDAAACARAPTWHPSRCEHLAFVQEGPSSMDAKADVDGSGNLYVALVAHGTLKLPNGEKTETPASAPAASHVQLMKFAPDCALLWRKEVVRGILVRLSGLDVDHAGNVALSHFRDSGTDVIPGDAAIVEKRGPDGEPLWTLPAGSVQGGDLELAEDGALAVVGISDQCTRAHGVLGASGRCVGVVDADGEVGFTALMPGAFSASVTFGSNGVLLAAGRYESSLLGGETPAADTFAYDPLGCDEPCAYAVAFERSGARVWARTRPPSGTDSAFPAGGASVRALPDQDVVAAFPALASSGSLTDPHIHTWRVDAALAVDVGPQVSLGPHLVFAQALLADGTLAVATRDSPEADDGMPGLSTRIVLQPPDSSPARKLVLTHEVRGRPLELRETQAGQLVHTTAQGFGLVEMPGLEVLLDVFVLDP